MSRTKVKPNGLTATVDALQQLYARYMQQDAAKPLRSRMEYVDMYLNRVSAMNPEIVKARMAARAGDKTQIPSFEVPVCYPQYDSAHAYLCGLFLTGFPIIGYVGSREQEDIAMMLTALSKRDQQLFNWTSNLMLAFKDLLRYHQFAVEADWSQQSISMITREKSGSRVSKKSIAGNRIKRLDPYNLYFDRSIKISDFLERGAFAVYVERSNYVDVKAYLASLQAPEAIFMNFNAALGSSPGFSHYYTPNVSAEFRPNYDPNDWQAFFGNNSVNNRIAASGIYERSTMYVRIIPQEYYITNVENAGQPAIYKLVFINGFLVAMRPLDNAHGLMPILISAGDDSGIWPQTNSFVENLMDMQDAASGVLNASFNSMRRAVSDRALYDPTRISGRDINSANPVGKIAVTGNSFNSKIADAYHQIPYRDDITPVMSQNLNMVMSLAQNTNGLNQASQGSFVKGNKTRQEFDVIMTKSDARLQKTALAVDSSVFSYLRNMFRSNYIQYSTEEELVDSRHNLIKIDPEKLLSANVDIQGVDGLNPASKMIAPDLVMTALNVIPQIPELSQTHDRAGLFLSLLKSQGLDIEQYRYTTAEIQQRQAALPAPQQQQGQQPAAQPTGQPTTQTPEGS